MKSIRTSPLAASITFAIWVLIGSSCCDRRAASEAQQLYHMVDIAQRLAASSNSRPVDFYTALRFIKMAGPGVVDEFGPLLASGDRVKTLFAGEVLEALIQLPPLLDYKVHTWPNLIPFVINSLILHRESDLVIGELLIALSNDGVKGHNELVVLMGPFLDREAIAKSYMDQNNREFDVRICDAAAYIIQHTSGTRLGINRLSRASPEAIARAREISYGEPKAKGK